MHVEDPRLPQHVAVGLLQKVRERRIIVLHHAIICSCVAIYSESWVVALSLIRLLFQYTECLDRWLVIKVSLFGFRRSWVEGWLTLA